MSFFFFPHFCVQQKLEKSFSKASEIDRKQCVRCVFNLETRRRKCRHECRGKVSQSDAMRVY